MVGRAARVMAEGTRGRFAAGAAGPNGRAAAATVGAPEVSRAGGGGTGGTAKVARLAEAGDCRATEATEVARRVGARGCCAAGAAWVAEWDGAGCWAERPERKEAWPRSAVASAVAMKRVWALMDATRVSHSLWFRVESSRAEADAWSSVRDMTEWRRKMESWERRGAARRSCSSVARSIAWRSEAVIAASSADTRARASPSSTLRRETFFSSACCAGSRLSQMDAWCFRWGGGPVMAMEARVFQRLGRAGIRRFRPRG